MTAVQEAISKHPKFNGTFTRLSANDIKRRANVTLERHALLTARQAQKLLTTQHAGDVKVCDS
jgi:hypothetical protein